MSNYLNFQNPDYTKTNIFKANSHYLSQIYAQKERKKENNSLFTFWTPINVENILKPVENSLEKKKHSSQSSSKDDPGSCSDSSSKPKSKTSANSFTKMKKSSKSNKKEKKEKSQPFFEDVCLLFNENQENEKKEIIKKTAKEIKGNEKENSLLALNQTIDDFEKTLHQFYEERKEKKLTKSSSSKSIENLKNLQKSLSQIEDDMDKRLKIMQPAKKNMEILAENIEKQQVFLTNEDLYEMTFQEKN